MFLLMFVQFPVPFIPMIPRAYIPRRVFSLFFGGEAQRSFSGLSGSFPFPTATATIVFYIQDFFLSRSDLDEFTVPIYHCWEVDILLHACTKQSKAKCLAVVVRDRNVPISFFPLGSSVACSNLPFWWELSFDSRFVGSLGMEMSHVLASDAFDSELYQVYYFTEGERARERERERER